MKFDAFYPSTLITRNRYSSAAQRLETRYLTEFRQKIDPPDKKIQVDWESGASLVPLK